MTLLPSDLLSFTYSPTKLSLKLAISEKTDLNTIQICLEHLSVPEDYITDLACRINTMVYPFIDPPPTRHLQLSSNLSNQTIRMIIHNFKQNLTIIDETYPFTDSPKKHLPELFDEPRSLPSTPIDPIHQKLVREDLSPSVIDEILHDFALVPNAEDLELFKAPECVSVNFLDKTKTPLSGCSYPI